MDTLVPSMGDGTAQFLTAPQAGQEHRELTINNGAPQNGQTVSAAG
jgi:hypothetical protein